MVRDVTFEAAVLRGGLLLGLVHEREVPDWAESLLGVSPVCDGRLAELCVAPIELSAMRESLYPLAREADPARVAAALLTLCAIAPSNATLSVADRVQQLQLLRFELRLPEEVKAGLQPFIVRLFDAQAPGTSHASATPTAALDVTSAATSDTAPRAASNVSSGDGSATSGADLARWLDSVREPAVFSLYVASDEEAAACVAMLDAHRQAGARYRLQDEADREEAGAAGSHRGSPDRSHGAPLQLLINEAAWLVATRERGPLPAASRIPDPRGLRALEDSPESDASNESEERVSTSRGERWSARP